MFMIIHTAYPNFEADEVKVAAWEEFLGDIPFETAKSNLLQHIRTSSFQPTPADLIGKKESREGPYIPNVEETREYLNRLEQQQRLTDGNSYGCPEHLKERLPWKH